MSGTHPPCSNCALYRSTRRGLCSACWRNQYPEEAEAEAARRRAKHVSIELNRVCLNCDVPFVAPRRDRFYCCKKCMCQHRGYGGEPKDPVKRRARNATKNHRRRVLLATAPYDHNVEHRALAERDGWTCHYCGGEVTREDWSIDHLLALSQGGTHTWDNVALAHRDCNIRRWHEEQTAA
jgi:5-methylcytosine-specific restriction endonuclease McrA